MPTNTHDFILRMTESYPRGLEFSKNLFPISEVYTELLTNYTRSISATAFTVVFMESGSFRPGSFRPGSFRPIFRVGRFDLGRWVVSAHFRGESFLSFFLSFYRY